MTSKKKVNTGLRIGAWMSGREEEVVGEGKKKMQRKDPPPTRRKGEEEWMVEKRPSFSFLPFPPFFKKGPFLFLLFLYA